jgi:hypothetical protein
MHSTPEEIQAAFKAAEAKRDKLIDRHRALDALCADYLIHNLSKLPSKTTVLELMQWSYAETQK